MIYKANVTKLYIFVHYIVVVFVLPFFDSDGYKNKTGKAGEGEGMTCSKYPAAASRSQALMECLQFLTKNIISI